MELLIAVLIAFGVVNAQDQNDLCEEKVHNLIKEHKITQDDIDKHEGIIGLEESDY